VLLEGPVIKLSELGVGAQFRVAHPQQRSKNNFEMSREKFFTVDKIFSMSPSMRICSTPDDARRYSLLPETPVLLSKDSLPFLEEVERFIIGASSRRKVTGYRMLYDGQGVELLKQRMSRHAATLVEDLYVTGIKYFSKEKIREILDRNRISPKYKDYRLLLTYRDQIHASGFMEVIYEVDPASAAEIREVVGV
jgi:hypothetical protein